MEYLQTPLPTYLQLPLTQLLKIAIKEKDAVVFLLLFILRLKICLRAVNDTIKQEQSLRRRNEKGINVRREACSI